MCVRPCMRDVFAIYDDHILPRLIMIIINIIILYFIQIRHTDDFPLSGIPASYDKSTSLLVLTSLLGFEHWQSIKGLPLGSVKGHLGNIGDIKASGMGVMLDGISPSSFWSTKNIIMQYNKPLMC